MRAFIATVDLVIHAASHADAQNRLHALLTDLGVHADPDPVLVDWSYIPTQRQPNGAWPKEVSIEPGWLDVPEGERDASVLFHDRDHVQPMLIVRTTHLNSRMRRLLESLAPGIIEYDWGWIVSVDAELDALAPILAVARARGCSWIKFDEEGPVFEELSTFGR
ncbi:MAG TPA: hypothetical protein VGL72_16200 [Bryobacteraceae bacterium]